MNLETNTIPIWVFIKNFSKSIFIDRNFQRRDAWETGDGESYVKTVYKGINSQPIVLVDIVSSKNQAIKNGDREEVDYFQELEDQGYKYISIDGQNRTKNMISYINGDKVLFGDDDEKTTFLDKRIVVQIYENMLRPEMREAAIFLNKQKSWNAQESRNPIATPTSSYIRKTSYGVKDITDKLKSVKKSRMQDDEYIAKTLYYEINKKPATSTGLDDMYLSGDMSTTHSKNIKIWKDILSYYKGTKKIGKAPTFNLYVLISYLTENGITINRSYYEEFFNEYYTQDLERWADKETAYVQSIKGGETWGSINGNINDYIDIKRMIIIREFKNLTQYVIQKDPNRQFSQEQTNEIYNNSNGLVRVNRLIDGEWVLPEGPKVEFVEVPLIDVLTNNEYEIDHVIPHSEGGLTIVENGEITSRDYNRWKSNKVLITEEDDK